MCKATTKLFVRLIVIYAIIWCPLATFQGGLSDVNCPRTGHVWDNFGYKVWYIFCAISNGGTGLFDAVAWFRFPAVRKEVLYFRTLALATTSAMIFTFPLPLPLTLPTLTRYIYGSIGPCGVYNGLRHGRSRSLPTALWAGTTRRIPATSRSKPLCRENQVRSWGVYIVNTYCTARLFRLSSTFYVPTSCS